MVVFIAPTPHFTPKHAWSFKNNALCGICGAAWAECLFRHRKHVEWRCYWQRVVFITAISLFNSLLGWVEILLYGKSIERQRVHPRPLFVLGHPRTGTTLLQNHLARDTEEFGTHPTPSEWSPFWDNLASRCTGLQYCASSHLPNDRQLFDILRRIPVVLPLV